MERKEMKRDLINTLDHLLFMVTQLTMFCFRLFWSSVLEVRDVCLTSNAVSRSSLQWIARTPDRFTCGGRGVTAAHRAFGGLPEGESELALAPERCSARAAHKCVLRVSFDLADASELDLAGMKTKITGLKQHRFARFPRVLLALRHKKLRFTELRQTTETSSVTFLFIFRLGNT
jgi:hypothetical protein